MLGLIVLAVMWPLSLWGHALGLTPSWHQLMNRNHHWMHHHYPLVGLRYLGAAASLIMAVFVASKPLRTRAKLRADERRRANAARAAAGEERRRQEFEAWLAGPPPPLAVPGRFTQNWIAENVPYLHPGQVAGLFAEMRRRGWRDGDIAARVAPYLPEYATTASP